MLKIPQPTKSQRPDQLFPYTTLLRAVGAPAKFLRGGPEQAGKGAGGDPPDRLLRDAIARRQRDHSPVGLAVDQLGERLAVVRPPPAGDALALLRCHQQPDGRLLRPLEGLADRRRPGAPPRIGHWDGSHAVAWPGPPALRAP